MNIRNVPFGYEYLDGALTVSESESKTVRKIFADYLAGANLRQIAETLTAQGVEYLPGRSAWDKARVKRILDCEKYTGHSGFPAIISANDYEGTQEKKSAANTCRPTADEDIKFLSSYMTCGVCGGKLTRHMDTRNKHPVVWKCAACGMAVPLSDSGLKGKLFALMVHPCQEPDLIENTGEEMPEVMDLTAKQLGNEIHRKRLSGASERELVELVKHFADANYRSIPRGRSITERLKSDFAAAEAATAVDRERIYRTVRSISLTDTGTLKAELQNGAIIEGSDRS